MERYLLVAAFGALGAVGRYAVDGWVAGFARGQFPWGTLAVNVAGSFALGVLVGLTSTRLGAHPNWRLALGVGFLGAFTTFSTFTVETVRLAEDSAYATALLSVAAMTALGMLAAVGGLLAGRAL
ncbi:MAG: fluoride efflux transporter CrcB [Thermoleophilaceae bacterium]